MYKKYKWKKETDYIHIKWVLVSIIIYLSKYLTSGFESGF